MPMLPLPNGLTLAEFKPDDREALVVYLNDRGIYEQTLRIPFPYTLEAADLWLAYVIPSGNQNRPSTNWAIRDADDQPIGGLGFETSPSDIVGHRAEIGYWLARPYWNQGIMSAAVRTACEFAFGELGLKKVTAHVFAFNASSARVLQKCNFALEGNLKRHYCKAGRLIDAVAYGLLRE